MVQPIVYLVEDNQPVRDSLVWMLKRWGLEVEAYCTPSDMLDAHDPTRAGCMILDLQLPEMTGLELRNRLVDGGCRLPFIVITGHGQVPDAKQAMQMGAVDFLEKPLDREVLIEQIWKAIDQDFVRRREQENFESIQKRIDLLSDREREVLDLVAAGRLTKQIARQLGVSTKTIEAHRSNITKKMQVGSVIQLVRLIIEYQMSNPACENYSPHNRILKEFPGNLCESPHHSN